MGNKIKVLKTTYKIEVSDELHVSSYTVKNRYKVDNLCRDMIDLGYTVTIIPMTEVVEMDVDRLQLARVREEDVRVIGDECYPRPCYN